MPLSFTPRKRHTIAGNVTLKLKSSPPRCELCGCHVLRTLLRVARYDPQRLVTLCRDVDACDARVVMPHVTVLSTWVL